MTRKYTVLLMLPDYLASNYGQETYLAHVEAPSPIAACRKAQRYASDHCEVPDHPGDYHAIACFPGWHDDVKPG